MKHTISLFCLALATSIGCQQNSVNPAAHTNLNGPKSRTTIILVHGTYGGNSEWVLEVDGMVTFASEIRNSAGAQNTRIEPFLWRTSIHHEARNTAARDLARLIDSDKLKNDRIIVVGHSHGGNVALASAGHTKRSIDTVICLATPHIHLGVSNSKKKQWVPVYCSPSSRRNIRKIINIQMRFDSVVQVWSKLRNGIDERQAIQSTTEWRSIIGNPRILDDGGAVKEFIEDVLDVNLVNNLAITEQLSLSDSEICLPCEIRDESAHNAIHSCRMGHILGISIASDFDQHSLEYLATTVIPIQSGDGEPISTNQQANVEKRFSNYKIQSGWTLMQLTAQLVKTERQDTNSWDLDGSSPDLYATGTFQGIGFSTRTVMDSRTATWGPIVHFRQGAKVHIAVFDEDILSSEKMGLFVVEAGQDHEFEGKAISLVLVWKKSHY